MWYNEYVAARKIPSKITIFNKEVYKMKNNDIVKTVVVGAAALLLPLFLVIPTIPPNMETIISLGVGLVAFWLITGLTARKGCRWLIALAPAIVILVVGASYIPIKLSGLQLLVYYIPVVVALLLSIGSHFLGWWKERNARPKRGKKREEGGGASA